MANLGDNLWRHQKGKGHQVANANHTFQVAEDEWRRDIQLILWEAKWSGDWEIQLGRKNEGIQDCEKDPMIIAGELVCKGHYQWREQRPWWD